MSSKKSSKKAHHSRPIRAKKPMKFKSIRSAQGGNVYIEGIECFDNVFVSFFSKRNSQGPDECPYVRPFDNAYMKAVAQPEMPLFHKHEERGTMLEYFKFDFCDGRRGHEIEEVVKCQGIGKNFPWKCYVSIRETNDTTTLNDWIESFVQKFHVFVQWCSDEGSNCEYMKWTYPFHVRPHVHQTHYPLFHEVLTVSVVQVIHSLYEDRTLEQLEQDTEGDQSFKHRFFSAEMNNEMYRLKLRQAWMQLEY